MRTKPRHREIFGTPLYTFYSQWRGYPTTINLPSLYYNWAQMMGFYGLDNREILELQVPADIDELNHASNTDEVVLEGYFDDSIEYIIPYIRREWIVAIYHKSPLISEYAECLLTPEIERPLEHPIFIESVKFSGDGYAEENIYEKINPWPRSGICYNELRNWVKPAVFDQAILNKFGISRKDLFKRDHEKARNLLSETIVTADDITRLISSTETHLF